MTTQNEKLFVVREDHIKLLRCMNVRFNDECEYGAPEIDPKRPYGNSGVEDDIRDILGRSLSDEECYCIHREMEKVLQIAVINCSLDVGQYERTAFYTADWVRSNMKKNAKNV